MHSHHQEERPNLPPLGGGYLIKLLMKLVVLPASVDRELSGEAVSLNIGKASSPLS